MVTIELEGRKYRISEIGAQQIYDEKFKRNRMKYRVKVDWDNIDSISFTFFDSILALEREGKTEMDDTDKITAFYSYLNSGLDFLQTRELDDYIHEFCPSVHPDDKEYANCKTAFNASKRTAQKLQSKFGLDEDRIVQILNKIQEKYPEAT